MAFSATNKQDIYKHFGLNPSNTWLDSILAGLEDGGTVEALTVAAITTANTALAAINTTTTEADELVEGDGAKFSYERQLAMKKSAYKMAVNELARICSWQPAFGEQTLTGFFVS